MWYREVPDDVRAWQDGNMDIWRGRSIDTTQKMPHKLSGINVVDRAARKWSGCLLIS